MADSSAGPDSSADPDSPDSTDLESVADPDGPDDPDDPADFDRPAPPDSSVDAEDPADSDADGPDDPDTLNDRVGRRPLIAASGAVALGVLLIAFVGLLWAFGPGAAPGPGGRAGGSTVPATLGGVALLWTLVALRVVRGVVRYAEGDGRPTGIGFAFAAVEGTVAFVVLGIAGAATWIAEHTSSASEVLAAGAYAVLTAGFVLALASIGRASVALLSE